MAYDVTSWFQVEAQKRSSSPVRKFTIGSSDYTNYVSTWPTFSQVWNEIRPRTFNLKLANDDGAFNFFINNRTTMVTSCAIQFGFTHVTSGDELITLFTGHINKIKFDEGAVSVRLVNKFKQLGERIIGDSKTPKTYNSIIPSDIAWFIVSSYGGFSGTQDSSNPDIDWTSFQTWAAVFSGDNVVCDAHYKGVKCTEALKRLANLTQSAIYEHDNKLYFHRFSLADSNSTVLDAATLLRVSAEMDDERTVNRQHVMADYDVTSRSYNIAVLNTNSASVNSYGLREAIHKDTQIWYVDSVSAINLAQRITTVKKEPEPYIQANTTLYGMLRTIGEMITATDNQINLSAQTFRIMEQSIDVNTGKVTLSGDASQIANAFILDTSQLDGTDILT